jgi:hypothetical protein
MHHITLNYNPIVIPRKENVQELSFIMMTTLLWIIIFGFLMSCIALVGGILQFILTPERLNIILLVLVVFAARSLMGGALLHMIPAVVQIDGKGDKALCLTHGWFPFVLGSQAIFQFAPLTYTQSFMFSIESPA